MGGDSPSFSLFRTRILSSGHEKLLWYKRDQKSVGGRILPRPRGRKVKRDIVSEEVDKGEAGP